MSTYTVIQDWITEKRFRAQRRNTSLHVDVEYHMTPEGHIERSFNLHELMMTTQDETFLVRVTGPSMLDAGILPGDLLVVNRSLTPEPGHIVVVALGGGIMVRRLAASEGRIRLAPDHNDMTAVDITLRSDAYFWGVATYVIRNVQHQSPPHDVHAPAR